MERRRYLHSVGMMGLVGFAGCLGSETQLGTNSESEPPETQTENNLDLTCRTKINDVATERGGGQNVYQVTIPEGAQVSTTITTQSGKDAVLSIISPSGKDILSGSSDSVINKQFRVAESGQYVFQLENNAWTDAKGTWATEITVCSSSYESSQGNQDGNEQEQEGQTEGENSKAENGDNVLSDESLIVNSKILSIQLRSERTIVDLDQPAVLTFSSTAFISASESVNVQLVIEAPSGVSVEGTDFVESGIGQYTTNFVMNPGESKGLRIRLEANEPGRYEVTGRAIYYQGNNKQNASVKSISIPIRVREDSVDG